jgi:hypothetical protein
MSELKAANRALWGRVTTHLRTLEHSGVRVSEAMACDEGLEQIVLALKSRGIDSRAFAQLETEAQREPEYQGGFAPTAQQIGQVFCRLWQARTGEAPGRVANVCGGDPWRGTVGLVGDWSRTPDGEALDEQAAVRRSARFLARQVQARCRSSREPNALGALAERMREVVAWRLDNSRRSSPSARAPQHLADAWGLVDCMAHMGLRWSQVLEQLDAVDVAEAPAAPIWQSGRVEDGWRHAAQDFGLVAGGA